MRIGIIGIGAMGTLMAAHLHEFAEVIVIGNWPAQLAALGADGLTLHHPDGRVTRRPIRATNRLEAIGQVDLALILVKSHQTDRAAAQARQLLPPPGLALTLQNGLGNLEKVVQAVGEERAALGVTAQGATLLKPGHTLHAGHGPTHLVRATRQRGGISVADVAVLFNRAGLETHLVNRGDSLLWGKLAINAGINPLTALLRVPNGFLAENEEARRLMSAAAQETAAVAKAQGIALPYPDAARRAWEVAQATAANHSSMLQDVLRGRPTEIDVICGEIVAHGRRLGITTPINEKLLQLIHSLERDQELPVSDNIPIEQRLAALVNILSPGGTI
ncbi:MAG: ketopantoate reductase family protein [Anaerolineae bacterium]